MLLERIKITHFDYHFKSASVDTHGTNNFLLHRIIVNKAFITSNGSCWDMLQQMFETLYSTVQLTLTANHSLTVVAVVDAGAASHSKPLAS